MQFIFEQGKCFWCKYCGGCPGFVLVLLRGPSSRWFRDKGVNVSHSLSALNGTPFPLMMKTKREK